MASNNKKQKLRMSQDVYNKLLWGNIDNLDLNKVSIIHTHKHTTKEIKFDEWIPIDKGGDVPYHRITKFKYNGKILWDRQQRIDNIFKNSGHKTLTMDELLHDNNNNSNNNDNNSEIKEDKQDDNNTLLNEYDDMIKQIIRMEGNDLNCVNLMKLLDKQIMNVIQLNKPNVYEKFARYIAWKYLEKLGLTHKYILFGSSKLCLDTHHSDLDVTILDDKNVIKSRNDCIQYLKIINTSLSNIGPFSLECNNTILSQCINEEEKDIHNLYNDVVMNIIDDKNANIVKIKPSLIRIIQEAMIPRSVYQFNITIYNKDNSIFKNINVSMDLTVNVDKTGVLIKRNKHIYNFMSKHCFYKKDQRIYQFLYLVKLWSQNCKIASSVTSTINGYGWIHIALFVLTYYYHSNQNNNDSECIYPDISLNNDTTVSYLFIQFIQTLKDWIIMDENQHKLNLKNQIPRKGMDIIKHCWIDNIRFYALYVMDPFIKGENLAKCVRESKGIPLIRNALDNTLTKLLIAYKTKDYQNFDLFDINQQLKQSNNIRDVYKTDIQPEILINEAIKFKLYSLKDLKKMKLNVPKRKWITCSETKNNDKNREIIIGQFNVLAQSYTHGTNDHYCFKCPSKYLKWKYRSPRILYEILQYNLDIICLQEIEKEYFDKFYVLNLAQFGYNGIFVKKLKVKTKDPKDGCAIFWKKDKYKYIKQHTGILGKDTKAFCICLCLRLQIIKNQHEIDVFCSHLKAGSDNDRENLRYKQMGFLLDIIKKFSCSNINKDRKIIFCADLNASNTAYSNFIPKVYPNLVDKHHKYRDNLSLMIKSCYKMGIKSEPKYTTFAGFLDRTVKCCIDYIFIGEIYQENNNNNNEYELINNETKVLKLLDILDENIIDINPYHLPNALYPSDHLLIATKLFM